MDGGPLGSSFLARLAAEGDDLEAGSELGGGDGEPSTVLEAAAAGGVL
jgi:hypothetical protein